MVQQSQMLERIEETQKYMLVEENGILAGRFIRPEAVRLDSVTPEFWETDDIKQLTTVISFIDPQGRFKKDLLAINRTVNYRGIRIYQGRSFGNAFFVEFIDGEGNRIDTILQIQNPPGRDKAGYGNFQVEGVQQEGWHMILASQVLTTARKNLGKVQSF